MNVFTWLKGRLSHRGKAMSFYRRGMAKSKNHQHQGAIDDYTSAIGLPETPPDVKAMALYNRALVYAASGDGPKATDDLNSVLAMSGARNNVKTEARRKLVRMESRTLKSNES